MIAHLSGTVLSWDESRLVVDVNGVGYEVFAPLSTSAQVSRGEAVSLHVHTLVREDAIQLYGFATRAERDMFLMFLGVSGVGPKVALALLSALPLADLAGAIGREDVTMLSRVPGVGKKTASRLALELKDKVGGMPVPAARVLSAQAGAAPPRGGLADAVSALVNLGYSKARAESAVSSVAAQGEELPLEELIRRGLATLSQGT